MIGQSGEDCHNTKKTIYYTSTFVANFAQTCSLISIYNGMYTLYSYYTPQ